MRKATLLLAGLLWMSSAGAQYFQKTYMANGTTYDNGRKGVNGVALNGVDNLYIQTGWSTISSINNPLVSVTDKNGNTVFVKNYPLVSNWAGDQVSAEGQAVAQDPATGNIIVVGDFNTTPTVRYGIFCMTLTSTGTVVAGSTRYFLQASPSRKLQVTAVKLITLTGGGKGILACGGAESATAGSYDPWVMRYDLAFTAGWFNIYDDVTHNVHYSGFANDLVESTFNGTPEIAVAGYEFNAGNYSGSLMRVNTTTGTLLSFKTYDSGVANGEERFTGITRCNSTNGIGVGYVLVGFSNSLTGAQIGSFDSWLMRCDNTGGTIAWNHTFNYSNNGDNYSMGVVERLNTSGAYEYYAAGLALSGWFGGSDAVVLKFGDNGLVVPNGEFTYGWGNNEMAANIDQANGTSVLGITVYGQMEVSAGNYDHYIVKAYYNGISHQPGPVVDPCHESLHSIDRNVSTPVSLLFSAPIVSITWVSATAPTPTDGTTLTYCNTSSVTGGSNARMASTGETPGTDFTATVYPNPVSGSLTELHAQLDLPESGEVQFQLLNTLGQIVYTNTQTANAGTSEITLSPGALRSGIYSLTITTITGKKSMLLSVQ